MHDIVMFVEWLSASAEGWREGVPSGALLADFVPHDNHSYYISDHTKQARVGTVPRQLPKLSWFTSL